MSDSHLLFSQSNCANYITGFLFVDEQRFNSIAFFILLPTLNPVENFTFAVVKNDLKRLDL